MSSWRILTGCVCFVNLFTGSLWMLRESRSGTWFWGQYRWLPLRQEQSYTPSHQPQTPMPVRHVFSGGSGGDLFTLWLAERRMKWLSFLTHYGPTIRTSTKSSIRRRSEIENTIRMCWTLQQQQCSVVCAGGVEVVQSNISHFHHVN